MRINKFAKLLLENYTTLSRGPGEEKYTGKYIFEIKEENKIITIEFVNSKKKGLMVFTNYYGKIQEYTLDEFYDLKNYNTAPFIEKIIDAIKQLSINYYAVDLGFKKTIKALFSKKRPQADIKMMAKFLKNSDIFIKANGKIIYDKEEINNRELKDINTIAKELLQG